MSHAHAPWRRWRLSQVTAARRLATDPLVPLLSLTALGLLIALGLLTAPALLATSSATAEPVAAALTWAVLGGLAGYTLSGSV